MLSLRGRPCATNLIWQKASNGLYYATVNMGRIIGWDNVTGAPTALVTIIKTAGGIIITMHPGAPKPK